MIKASDGRAAVLRELAASGLSMAEFCRRRGLPYGTVALWRSQARREAGRFIEVEAVDGSAPAAAAPPAGGSAAVLCAELMLPGGMVLRIYQSAGAGGEA